MFLLLPPANIKDNVTFQISDNQGMAAQATRTRNILREYSNIETLIGKVQGGEVIMTKKVDFDNYMKMQVDLMRSSVYSSTPCNFLYDGYLGSEPIDTKGFNIK